MSDKLEVRTSSDKLMPDLVKSLEHLGSSEYWRYYSASDSESDTRSSYSIASLTFKRDRRGVIFPDIDAKLKSSAVEHRTPTYALQDHPTSSLNLPDISSCVVMTTSRRRRRNKKKKQKGVKPRKSSGRYFPEISGEGVGRQRAELEVGPRSRSSAEEYSPALQRRRVHKKEPIKLPNI